MTSAQLLTQAEAAERLGLRPNTLEKWRVTGIPKLPFVKLGGAVRYRVSDIDEFIARSVVGGECKPKRRRAS